eukprot:gene13308-17830_t
MNRLQQPMVFNFVCGASIAASISYIWLYNWVDGMPLHALITKASSVPGRKHLFNVMFSPGFIKSSIRRFKRHLYLLFNPIPLAKVNQFSPDCKLVTLEGEKRGERIVSENKNSQHQPCIKLLTIYIEEAHAQDDWKLPKFLDHPGKDIVMHKSINDRIQAAKRFVVEQSYPIEVVCDSMNNEAMERFNSIPERLYIIENGQVVYAGGRGPFDYKPEEVMEWCINRFGAR